MLNPSGLEKNILSDVIIILTALRFFRCGLILIARYSGSATHEITVFFNSAFSPYSYAESDKFLFSL
jgi:hypothetical protein